MLYLYDSVPSKKERGRLEANFKVASSIAAAVSLRFQGMRSQNALECEEFERIANKDEVPFGTRGRRTRERLMVLRWIDAETETKAKAKATEARRATP